MVTSPSPDVQLAALEGDTRPLEEWLTTFHMASVILDPFTNESSWVLKPARRILDGLSGSSARVNFVVTGTVDEARRYLGPLSREYLSFADPDRAFVRSLGLEFLPAFVFVRVDGTVPAAAQGWNPQEWRTVAEAIAATTSWQAPAIPGPGDPNPFHGTPALG